MKKKLTNALILPLTLITVACLGFQFFNSSMATAAQWQSLKDAPSGLVQQFKQDNAERFKDSSEVADIEFLKVNVTKQTIPLYLIDTSSTLRSRGQGKSPFCGQVQCLFSGYIERSGKFKPVTNGLISRFVPRGTEAVQVTNKIVNGLPCLRFNQAKSFGTERIVSNVYCFDGLQYLQSSNQI